MEGFKCRRQVKVKPHRIAEGRGESCAFSEAWIARQECNRKRSIDGRSFSVRERRIQTLWLRVLVLLSCDAMRCDATFLGFFLLVLSPVQLGRPQPTCRSQQLPLQVSEQEGPRTPRVPSSNFIVLFRRNSESLLKSWGGKPNRLSRDPSFTRV